MSKEEETNTPIEQLAAVMTAYIESTAELDQQRAKADEKEINEIILKQLLPMHALYI